MRIFTVLSLATGLLLFCAADSFAQGKSGFLHMDPDQKEEQKKNQHITLQDQRDTISLYDQHGEFLKDTVVVNDERVKHGVWIETDSTGKRVRRKYKRGKLVEEEEY